MNNEVFIITGTAGTGKSALATRFQAVGETLDLECIATTVGKDFIVLPELLELAIKRGCRVFCGCCDNLEDVTILLKRLGFSPIFFVLTAPNESSSIFSKRRAQMNRMGWTQKKWLERAAAVVVSVREMCRRLNLPCYQLQRTSDGASVIDQDPGRAAFKPSRSYFMVPEIFHFSYSSSDSGSSEFVGEFREFMRHHWREIIAVNDFVVPDSPLELWPLVRGYRTFIKKMTIKRKTLGI